MPCSYRALRRAAPLILITALVQACSDGPTTSASFAAGLAPADLPTTATVHSVVQPGVVVIDAAGRPVRDVEVTFEVTAGGGTVTPASVRTDAYGRAAAAWTLGRSAGVNTIMVRTPGGSTTFDVHGVAATPALMVAAAAVPAMAAAGGNVEPAPGVRVTDEHGNAVAGVAVTFAIVRGGGATMGAERLTDEAGTAVVGAWRLGAERGENVLVATATGLSPVTFTVEALTVSTGARIQAVAGDDTTCPAGTASCSFSVRVTDEAGAALAGEAVVWTGSGGTTTSTVTNVRGYTTAPNLGPNVQAGSYVQTARLLGSGEAVTFRYRLVQDGGFRIDMRFTSEASPAVRNAFEQARARWEQVITGNLPEVALTGSNQVAANACGITHPAVNEVVDDVLIFVEVVPIDGPGKVLGSAGPCLVRGATGLPILGVVRLDRDDLELMGRNGTLQDVVLHEIGHVLGLGTLWNRFSLLQGAGTADPHYTGQRAHSGFLLGGGTALNGIPVENSGGSGTRDAHWRESVLGTELMTGYINSGGNPLSRITIGSLMDMGYQVNFGAADAFGIFPSGALPHPDAAAGTRVELVEVPLPPPLRVW